MVVKGRRKGYVCVSLFFKCLRSFGCYFFIWFINDSNIRKGYFDDVYDTPTLDGNGWKGFTRDYHQFEGVFSEDGGITEIDPPEYLEDLLLYKEKSFEFEETTEVFNLMVSFLEEAIKQGVNVKTEKV